MHPLNIQYHYIDQEDQMLLACSQLKTASVLYIDTEFHRESSYYPKLALVQVLGLGQCYLFDPLQLEDLQPLWDLIHQPSVVKVFHAARQDLECIFHYSHKIPYPIFDTQVAASLLGYGSQIGFSPLGQCLLDITLNKEESYSDWLMRPLTESQKNYAACDVLYLEPMYQQLILQLEKEDRVAWLHEEQDHLYHPDIFQVDSKQAFQRVKGFQKLKGQRLAVLRELALWREGLARDKNMPRRRAFSDEGLIQLSRSKLPTLEQMLRFRGISAGHIKKHSEVLREVIAKGLACEKSDWPAVLHYHTPSRGTVLRQELLLTLLKLRAYQENIAVELLANKKDLMAIAAWKSGEEMPDLPCLQGWRKKLVGHDMLTLLEGKTCLEIDMETTLPNIRKNA
ncbi:MAG: ribonuclease D [Mariprofundaceae bacterium]|nr:ribonuclease D [Mariprofundaceae bacterium]